MYTIYIKSTLNNTHITLCDDEDKTLSKSSAGCLRFKGSRKSTRNAAQAVGEHIGKACVSQARVLCRGIGNGKEGAIRGLRAAGVAITCIHDITAIAHNGCRLPKRRRV
jgi:small subunit ribosomal protein S11